MFFCPIFEWLEMKKKRFPFASKKQQLFSLLICLFFFGFAQNEKKKISLLLGFIKRKKKVKETFFLCLFFFFASLNDDNWWQVGRWYGIPNLVMTQRGDCGRGSARRRGPRNPRGPKLKIRGHSAPRSAARIPVDVCRTLIKQTISDDSDVYFSIIEY